MKKLLLMVAMTATTMCGFAQVPELTGEDITPSNYKDWAGGTCTIPKWHQTANINAPVVQTLNNLCGFTYDGSGMVAFVGAAQWTTAGHSTGTSAEDLNVGTAIVDMGGEIGKVWAFSGPNSKASEKWGCEFPKAKDLPGWFNINFFGDPNRTPKGGKGNTEAPTDKHIHVRIIMNVCANTPDAAANIFNTIYPVHNDGAVIPANTNTAAGTAVTTGSFTSYDDEEEMTMYDKTKWLVYEIDTWCPADDTDPVKSYAPLRVKMELLAGNWNNATVFIKEMSFTEVTGAPTIPSNQHKQTFITLKPGAGAPQIVTGVDAITTDVQANGKIFNLAGQRVQNAQNGIFIQNGKKVIK